MLLVPLKHCLEGGLWLRVLAGEGVCMHESPNAPRDELNSACLCLRKRIHENWSIKQILEHMAMGCYGEENTAASTP